MVVSKLFNSFVGEQFFAVEAWDLEDFLGFYKSLFDVGVHRVEASNGNYLKFKQRRFVKPTRGNI